MACARNQVTPQLLEGIYDRIIQKKIETKADSNEAAYARSAINKAMQDSKIK